ncbi:hypothetical protein PHJA_001389000 [Phtheirospermum japonicum]|uniref:Protein LNK2 n=1 Tax=Phtheirospermum japonicum TaxID=374723 RepID=A0A830C5S8_9LAMI|nr:hypothetical protein PHJA_001389000 [Phtheirospermum japonicum]
MFDWNDEELTNIIWGEAGENDDHIVPYDQIEAKPPVLYGDPTEKEASHQTLEQKKHSNPKHDTGEPPVGFGLKSWRDGPDPSSSNAAKADQGSTSDITKSSKNGSLKDETAQFDKDSGIFENPPKGGEQGDFVDYEWANIGSFDDLDRIFSNNDPIFGDMSVGNANELWPSSKDVPGDSSDLPIGALRPSIEQSEMNARHMLDPSQSYISGYGKLNEIASHASQDTFVTAEKIRTCGNAATVNEFPDKVNRPKKLSKGQKSTRNSEIRWTPPGRPFQQVNSPYAPPMVNQSPPLVLTQPIPLHRPGPFQPNHFPGSPLASSPLYGGNNMMNHYSSGYEVPNANSSKNSEDVSVGPPVMTPKEKIEKLRKRQQMRAMLAIQKQQMQFGNQGSVSEHSSMDGGKGEPNSPVEHYDSNTICTAFDNCSVEESVLYRLQDTIAKMDMRIRLCIRDSLFRLAQSAMWRQYPNETSSASTSGRDDVRSNKDIVSHERFTRMHDVETDTNPIDRTVAHLLFHRPLEFSGKPAETPESPLSANLPYAKKANPMKSLAMESDTVFSEGGETKNGLCFGISENATNDENTDVGQTKAETSK